MEKLVYCRLCGQQISSKAKKCPHCGARLKNRHIFLKIVLGIIAFALLSSFISRLFDKESNEQASTSSAVTRDSISSGTASNQSNTGTKAGSTVKTTQKPTQRPTQKPTVKPTQKPTPIATEKPTPQPMAGLGERLEEDGIAVTLISVQEISKASYFSPEKGNVFILFEFLIENNTSNELTVSSMMSFSMYYDGLSAPLSITALTAKGSANQLDGTIAAGKKFKGVIGYEIPKDWEELEVSFRPDIWYSTSFDYKVTYQEAKR